jgi:hypothetical protein
MKNIKIKSVLLAIVFLSVMSFVGTVDATGASVYVSPASLTKTTGDVFNVSVGFNASGNKVCAVEGTLNFKNLSCQSITVASGFMTQATPTCSNPYFLIGIPNCTTTDKVLMTVSVKAGSAGIASISPTSVDVIGEGSSAGTGSIAGNYTISAVVAPAPVVTPTISVASTTTSTPKAVTKPIKKANKIVETPVQQENAENNLAASVGATSSTTGSTVLWVLLILVVVLGSVYGIYYFKKKGKKEQI